MTKRKKNEGKLEKCSSSSSSAPKAKIQKKKSISNTKRTNLFNQITIISNGEEKFNQTDVDRKAKGRQQKKKSVANTKKANLFNQTIISNVEDATQKLNHISRGKSVVAPTNTNTNQMDVDWKAKGRQQKEKSVANTKKANLFNQTIISNGEEKFNHISKGKSIVEPSNQMDVDRKAKGRHQKKKSVANTKKANLFDQTIISNVEDATQKLNHISRGKSVVALSNNNTYQMDVDWKAKGQQKKKSVANTKKTNLFNQTIISNGEDTTQKFDHISKGKSVVEPSNDNTVQMDVDRATDHLQEEILMDILSRLPVRSLLRFKCVSNIWKTLISEPYFTMKHLNCAKNDQGSQKLLILRKCPKDHIFSIYCCPLSPVQLVDDVQKLKLDCPSNPKPRHCTILCFYDGLAVIKVTDILGCDSSTLLLWNPSTRESIVLPSPEFPQAPESRFGLGYDSTSGEYKILRIFQDFGHDKLPNEILALKSGSWRRIVEPPRGICSLVFAMQFLAFVHATYHWIAISSNYFVVVLFDISNEVYGEIPLSEEILSLRPGPSSIGVCVLGGMLCVHSNTFLPRKYIFKIWVLKEYGVKGSWMPLLTIEDSWFLNAKPKYRFADGEVLFLCKSYKPSGHAFRTCSGSFRSWPRCDTIQGGHAFTESLISPKSLTY